MNKIFATLTIFFSLLAIFTNAISASENNFTTSLRSEYQVNEAGKTRVTHHFSMTNLTPNFYADQYTYQTSLVSLSNIEVINDGQPIAPKISESQEKTIISFSFPNIVVGEGKTRSFSIAYDSEVFSTKAGEILEITIPATNTQSSYQKQTIELIVDASHGQPYRLEPNPDQEINTPQNNHYKFNQLRGSAITAVFGNQQSYLIEAKYYLENKHPSTIKTKIALPPDTSWQEMQYSQIDPKPLNITIDEDGNWLAEYLLETNSQKVINISAIATLHLQPRSNYPVQSPVNQHYEQKPYWEANDARITALSSSNNSVEDLYGLVVDKLNYTEEPLSYDRKRLGASQSLIQPNNAVCQEFTDLFIALTRASGIASRRATGFAFTNQPQIRPTNLKGDILHTWPEFYDAQDKIWQPVDPTWEDTTNGVDYFNYFDLNHIVFAYNGIDSTYPAPVGSYKLAQNNEQKTVSVTLESNPPVITPQFDLQIVPKKFGFLTIPGWYNITVNNLTGKAWYNINLKLSSDTENFSWKSVGSSLTNATILPFAQDQYSVLMTKSGWIPSRESVMLSLDTTQNPTQYVESESLNLVIPTYLTKSSTYFIMGGSATISTLIAGSILVWQRKRNSSLRRQS